MKLKILVAEDDNHTREALIEIFENEGHRTLSAADGGAALKAFEKESPDVICLDIMMPDMDGYEVCRKIRAKNETVPIIFISAKSEEIDKVLGLELGADDYISKPFGVKEVVARLKAVVRRSSGASSGGKEQSSPKLKGATKQFTMGHITIVPGELRVYGASKGEGSPDKAEGPTTGKADAGIDISPRDLSILTLLYENKGIALDRNTIFNECWSQDYIPSSRTLDQQISQLRKKIEEDPRNPAIIRTVQGVGYRYDG